MLSSASSPAHSSKSITGGVIHNSQRPALFIVAQRCDSCVILRQAGDAQAPPPVTNPPPAAIGFVTSAAAKFRLSVWRELMR